ncbi:MAG: prolyl oligopeptidase family serine peptidase [Bacteroidota bacterium]
MRKYWILLFCVGVGASLSAQSQKKKAAIAPVKKPLTHDVYDHWKEIPYKAVSSNGDIVVLTVNPQEGDGKVVFYNLKNNTQDSVKRATEVEVTFDSRHGVFKIKPPLELVRDLRRQKKKKEDLPKDSLGIFEFDTKKLDKIADVRSFKIPEKSGGWVAYQLEAKKESKAKFNDKKVSIDSVSITAKVKKIKKNTDDNGYTLVLRKFSDGKEVSFGYVRDYIFSKYAHGLLFASTGNDSTMKAGVYWYDLKSEKILALYEGKAKQKFKGLSTSEDGMQAAFTVDADTTKAPKRYPQLYHWKNGDVRASVLANENTPGVPSSWIVNEFYTPLFSKDGSKLFLGVNPQPVVQDTMLLPEEIVNVEVWNWQDNEIYPQQNKQLDNEKKRSHLSVVHLADKKFTMLGSTEIPFVNLADDGNAPVALGHSDLPYRNASAWDPRSDKDIYIINISDGSMKNVAKKITADPLISPKAHYVYWFSLRDTSWFAYSRKTEKIHRLAAQTKIRFADEEDDHPDYPSSYGLAGWTADDKQLLVYDRYDIWALDAENNKAPVNLTAIGRQQNLVFRYVKLDPEERFINPESDLLLSAFNEVTKASGYYKLSLKDNKLTKLLMSDHRYAATVKARQADRIIFTRENFTEYPDVWVSKMDFEAPKKFTNVNPQQKQYLWGTVEHVNWRSLDNVPLQGLLYKPENFDPKKKYPMIVYFYEKNSDNINNHIAPAPIRSYVNFSYYVSNGYLVFVPDIVYKIGYPGESAHNCILPGVTSLIAKGFVDEKNIGVQGHSWGGYQTAYLITRTNLFKAAEAGAPVSNMISAYGGIRWESGFSRMFQYERAQSRIGATLWEAPIRFIENSPIFFADKIQTPLLMMHNDADGAVPWYQGIEYYMALKRLNKPVWMLNYNHQGHGLTQRQDRTDFAIRMSQFFDHYLKGAPMPAWMKKGIPAVEKGINKGYATD